ncbi:hypothetical protein Si103_01630 [Streptococcus infantarius subsp. infantarius]|nr:hypothetical protein [Streptococcus infantarius subsp. infantarius]MCO4532131.1 hypothetical protein [Streptococcus infantarius subsp. infantarius]MCO4533925.1 hypothetical protein [Streptococcus infantarius subsp. infantarius]MCO4535972.1 hypothetical protein [Streptococcus infantarius subsp. infantarius]MCO4537108.1 hypothetical protein [Streptococcus infantarius subsp. infantarius]
MLENLLRELNSSYSEPIINPIILSVAIIVAGMFLLSYGIKRINSSLKINFGNGDYLISERRLKYLIVIFGVTLYTFLSLEVLSNVLVKSTYYLGRSCLILLSLLSLLYILRNNRFFKKD